MLILVIVCCLVNNVSFIFLSIEYYRLYSFLLCYNEDKSIFLPIFRLCSFLYWVVDEYRNIWLYRFFWRNRKRDFIIGWQKVSRS